MADALPVQSDERRELTQALRALTIKQRNALRAWAKRPEDSLYAVGEQMGFSSRTVWTWLRTPKFMRAHQLIEKQALDAIGITAQYVLGRTKAVVERSMQAEEVVDREGNPTGMYEFDGQVALKGLDMLGKYRRLWTDDRAQTQAPIGPGLTVIVQGAPVASVDAAQDGPRAAVRVNLAPPEP
jgi:hypothetical protein